MNQLLGTKTTCSASYGKEKTPFHIFYLRRHQGKSHQHKFLWYETNRTPATQNKKSPSDYAVEKKNTNKYTGRNQQEKSLP